ncbi:MAG: secretion system protein E, partial [Archaeoglobaceae archaeon]|nr:secretion system protein E [Archaeoglobaceae archaeon]MCX8152204.1 secretion system protein E [Archaeoglobaceae archaeon]MDW8013990.1 secretion system protein E [Archaeoglobaceae archaeon]
MIESHNNNYKLNEELEEYEKEAFKAIEDAKKFSRILGIREEKKFLKKEIKEVEKVGKIIEYELPKGWRVVEEYWILEPYCKVLIIYNDEEKDYRYVVVEPNLSSTEYEIYKELSLVLRDEIEKVEDDGRSKKEILKMIYDKIIKEIKFKINDESYYKILYYMNRDFLLYGKITAFILDRVLEDISCNGYRKPIYVFHKNYTNIPTNIYFERDELDSFVVNLAQKCGK